MAVEKMLKLDRVHQLFVAKVVLDNRPLQNSVALNMKHLVSLWVCRLAI